jgi:hypothetical protein
MEDQEKLLFSSKVFQQRFPNSAYQYQTPKWKATGMQYFHPLQNKPVSFPCQSVPEKKKVPRTPRKSQNTVSFFLLAIKWKPSLNN